MPTLLPALSAGWNVADFRRLILVQAAQLAMTRDGADWDPLHHAMMVAKSDPDTLQEMESEQSQFGGPIASALTQALENAGKTPGWEIGFKLIGDDGTEFFLLDGSMTMAGDAASVSIDRLPDESSLRLILLGSGTWSSGDQGKTWRKSGGGRYERIFMALASAFRDKWLAPQGAAGKWLFFGMSSHMGTPDEGGRSREGDFGVMRWQGKVPIYETYEIERPRGPGPGEHAGKRHTFSITKSASGSWRLDGIKQELDLGLGGRSVESVQMGMRPLYRKPEIKAPRGCFIGRGFQNPLFSQGSFW